jgi:hypothetical protein
MSKAIKEFFTKVKKNFDITKKFRANISVGSCILLLQTSKNDADYQLHLDAGKLINDHYQNIVLQVNSQARNTGLKEWVKKQDCQTHAKLATTRFDTLADDLDAEADRVLAELEAAS